MNLIEQAIENVYKEDDNHASVNSIIGRRDQRFAKETARLMIVLIEEDMNYKFDDLTEQEKIENLTRKNIIDELKKECGIE